MLRRHIRAEQPRADGMKGRPTRRASRQAPALTAQGIGAVMRSTRRVISAAARREKLSSRMRRDRLR